MNNIEIDDQEFDINESTQQEELSQSAEDEFADEDLNHIQD